MIEQHGPTHARFVFIPSDELVNDVIKPLYVPSKFDEKLEKGNGQIVLLSELCEGLKDKPKTRAASSMALAAIDLMRYADSDKLEVEGITHEPVIQRIPPPVRSKESSKAYYLGERIRFHITGKYGLTLQRLVDPRAVEKSDATDDPRAYLRKLASVSLMITPTELVYSPLEIKYGQLDRYVDHVNGQLARPIYRTRHYIDPEPKFSIDDRPQEN